MKVAQSQLFFFFFFFFSLFLSKNECYWLSRADKQLKSLQVAVGAKFLPDSTAEDGDVDADDVRQTSQSSRL